MSELGEGIRKVDLHGRMDIEGTQKIATQFTSVVATGKASVIVDLSGVDFMASIGIGLIVSTMNALKKRGGKMVLLNAKPIVALVLEKSAINTIIPMVQDLDSARSALSG